MADLFFWWVGITISKVDSQDLKINEPVSFHPTLNIYISGWDKCWGHLFLIERINGCV